MAERIKEAREFGDISENSEYDDAKNEQMMLEQKIAQLEERLRTAQALLELGDLLLEHHLLVLGVVVLVPETPPNSRASLMRSATSRRLVVWRSSSSR